MISIKETTYGNFGKCLAISNDAMEVYVTIDIGPRIIKCNLKGTENLMFEDIERKKTTDVSSVFGEGKEWNIYGGHRMWLSPEKFPETYYPDCEKVVYSTNATGATFEAPIQAVTGLQFTMNITMDEKEPKFTATHYVKNTKNEPIKGAMWCLSVMGQGGAVVVPQPTENTGLLANRILAVWPYTNMTDERIFWGKNYIALRQKPEIADSIKYGINNTAGKIAYINHGQALVKSYTPNHPNGEYPDFGVSCEVYACELFTEAETLSELKTIAKGESIVHAETWTLTDGIEIGEFTNETLAALAEKIF